MDAVLSWAADVMAAYKGGFDRGDAEFLSAFYEVPAVFVTATGTHLIGDHEALASGVRGLITSYQQAGYKSAEPEVLAARDLGESLREIDVRWRILGKDGVALWSYDAAYVLRLRDEVYRITAVVNPTGR